MADLSAIICEAIERAAISGLCRDGQIEIATEAARKARPDMAEAELIELVELEAGR